MPPRNSVQTAMKHALDFGLPLVRSMEETILKVEGMSCDACIGHVTRALMSVPGVIEARVDLRAGRAMVLHDGASDEAMLYAVEEEGYKAQVVSSQG